MTDESTQEQAMQLHLAEVQRTARCLYTAEQVDQAYDAMAVSLTKLVKTDNPLCLSVVIGGMIPFAALMMRLDFPLQMDYIHASRYQGKTQGAELVWHAYPKYDLTDRVVVVVDDIIDQGITLKGIVDYIKQQGARKIYTVALLDKPSARHPSGHAKADIVGLEVMPFYVFGSGLDYRGYLRNVPGIFAIDEQLLAEK